MRPSLPILVPLLLVSCLEPVLDTTDSPPVVVILEPGDGSSFAQGEVITFEGRTSDDAPVTTLITTWLDNGEVLADALVPDDDGFVTFSTTDLALGSHAITFRALDADNLKAEEAIQLEITEADVMPRIVIDAPVSGDRIEQGESFLFEVTVSDPQDAPEDLLVTLESNLDGFVCDVLVDGSGQGLCQAPLQVAGDHRLTFTVTDLDGNEASRSTILPVDPVPVAPTITVIHPVPGERPRLGQPFTFEVEVSDRQDAPTALAVSLSSSVAGFVCGLTVTPAGAATCVAALTPAGNHVLTFTVGDTDGHESKATVSTIVSDGTDIDDDGDGLAEIAGDCDDTDATIYPGAPELADGLDQDCDGTIDEGTDLYDDDGDGFCESLSIPCTDGSDLGDCQDANRFINPLAAEVCGDGIDNDCDGSLDAIDAVGCTPYFFDGDGDGAGAPGSAVCRCVPSGANTALSGTDCDDTRASVGPNAPELPDGIDNDCNGTADEGTALFDDDGDGYCESSGRACTDGSLVGDCDDGDQSINPGAPEVCGNGVDDDCDRIQDEANALGCIDHFADADGDSFGDPDRSACVCGPTATYVVIDDRDCDDAAFLINPNGFEFADGVDNDCDGTADEGTTLFDDDGDGYCESTVTPCTDGSLLGDCDDATPVVSPDGLEVCNNNRDDDCDGQQDEPGSLSCLDYYADGDSDGYGDPGRSACLCAATPLFPVRAGDDCDDSNATVGPGGAEVADGLDNDCDGTIDEGTSAYDDDGDGYCESTASCIQPGVLPGDCNDANAAQNPGEAEICNNPADEDCSGRLNDPGAIGCVDYWRDLDSDGYGAPGATQCTCNPISPFTATNDDDCDDTLSGNNPRAAEVPDRVDNDCDGVIDEGTRLYDDDGDGFCEGQANSCSDGSTPGDCNDSNPGVSPGQPEVCNNGIDDNCNGGANESGAVGCTTYYVDSDRDGFGSTTTTVCACTQPGNTTTTGTDCNDANPLINPNASEGANGVDDNCNGVADEGTARFDNDGDGYCAAASCTPQPGEPTPGGGDCDDTNPNRSPGANEVCNNSVDDNCNNRQNEGIDATGCNVYSEDFDGDGFGGNTSACYCQPTGIYTTTDSTDCDDRNRNVYPGQSAWFTGPRSNGTWDYNCDNSSERRYRGEYECECIASVFGIPVVIDDFEAGWRDEPSCGQQGVYYTSCRYTTAQIDIFGICNPLGPEIASTIGRTQQCR